MNREETKKLLEKEFRMRKVKEHFVNGGIVEMMHTDRSWHKNSDPGWASNVEYRIKPKPREVWINVYPNGMGEGYHDRKIDAFDALAPMGKVAKFVEVLEDE